MLQFIYGQLGYKKTCEIKEIISKLIRNNEKNKLLLLIPDENILKTEKNILSLFGSRLAAKVKIITFAKLPNFVYNQIGNIDNSKYLSTFDKILLMSLVMDKVESKLKIFSNQPYMINLIISTLNEFKKYNINKEQLINVTKKINDQTLKLKLEDIILILDAYSSLLKEMNYLDSNDKLTKLSKILEKNNLFCEYDLFIDGFDEFTTQQLSVIKVILSQCKNCYVSLYINNKITKNNLDLFKIINSTINNILKIAAKNNIIIKDPIYIKNENFPDKIHVFEGKNEYDEIDFVCRLTKKLVFEKNYRYKDFVIITQNINNYKYIIDIYFKKYNIPCFVNYNENIESNQLIQTILTVFEIINTNYDTKNIIKYLKIGLISINIDEIALIENYVWSHNISGTQWLKNFTLNPEGFKPFTEKSREKLTKINEIRKKIIYPIQNLRNKIINNPSSDVITKSVFEFFEETNITNYIKLSHKFLDKKAINNQIQIWNTVIDILNSFIDIFKNKKMSLEKYIQYFKIMVNSHKLKPSIKNSDKVSVVSLDDVSIYDAKTIFLIGAVEGNFPKMPKNSGIFNYDQREALVNLGLPLCETLEDSLIKEKFLLYKLITLPLDEIFITWASSSILGNSQIISPIVKEIISIFSDVDYINNKKNNLIDQIWNKELIFELCVKNLNSNSKFFDILKNYLYTDENYKDKLKFLENRENKYFEIEKIENAKNLFGENIKISASQIEKYFLCNFSYFCKYGMRIKDHKKFQLDALEFGSLIHFILEQVFKNHKADELLKVSDQELILVINSILFNYIKMNLGNLNNFSDKFKYLFNRVKFFVLPLIRHISEELNQSEFIPVGFEFSISERGIVKPLKFTLSDGTEISIIGKIDRIDLMNVNNKEYMRIIDYKTGIKEFNLSDILYGINLQMLIYFNTLLNSPESKYSKVNPAGILYMPAVSPSVNLERNKDTSYLDKEKKKKLRMNGLILDDLQIIYGMEKEAKGEYIPVLIKDGVIKNKKYVINTIQFKNIIKYINKLIIFMGENLHNGIISANPLKGDYDACAFCEYKIICQMGKCDETRDAKKLSNEEFFEKINLT